MDQPIPFRGQITPEIYGLIQSVNSRLVYHLGTIVPIVMVVYGLLLFAFRRQAEFLFVPVGTAIVIFLLRKLLRRIFLQLKYNGTFYDEFIFIGELNDEAMVLRDEKDQLELPWAKMQRFKTGPDLLLLYKGSSTFHVLHRSFFASSEVWEAVQGLVRSKIAKGA
nr:YcxB family protein [uncultured Holophaga sp.]